MINSKDQTKDLRPGKTEQKAIQDNKSQTAASKAKKAPAPQGQPKKRRLAFFTDVVNELRKVIWPSRQETTRLTLIVIGICLIMALILGLLDYGFSELVAKVFLGGK